MNKVITAPNRYISEKESRAISVIRVFSMLSIVLCHYVGWFPNLSAVGQMLNVGVPLFFIISGFLYGQKEINEVIPWYKKQLIKIVIPIYLYYLITGLILLILGRLGNIDAGKVVCQILCLQGILDGGIGNIETGALWFITFILICYLITPLLQRMRDRITAQQAILVVLVLMVIESIVIIHITPQAFMVNISGVITYILGYFGGVLEKENHRKKLPYSDDCNDY